jgi:K+-transporting ATPase A subunit
VAFGPPRSWEFTMATVFYTLAVLACPVAMGLMMFMMMRGQNKNPARPAQGPADRAEVDALRAEIEALKADRPAQRPQPQP